MDLNLSKANKESFLTKLKTETYYTVGLLNEYRILVKNLSDTLYEIRKEAGTDEIDLNCDSCTAAQEDKCPYYIERDDDSGFVDGPDFCMYYIAESLGLQKVLADIQKR